MGRLTDMREEGESAIGARGVAFARSSLRCGLDYQSLPFVTYASTDLDDGEAEEAVVAVGIDALADPRPLAFTMWDDDVRRRLEALVGAIERRFVVSTYERVGLAAHRLASIVVASAADQRKGAFQVGGNRDRLESMLLKTLRAAAVDHDVEKICWSCSEFTRTLLPYDLPYVLPEFEDAPRVILATLLPHAGRAVGAALAKWGTPDGLLHGADLAEVLDRQVAAWRRGRGAHTRFATSDADAAEAFSAATAASPMMIVQEGGHASMRLAALLANLCAENSDPAMTGSPLLTEDFARHDAS